LDDNNPPDVNDTINNPHYVNMTMPDQPLALKLVDFAGLVVPDANGEIIYLTQRYTYVPNSEAVSLLARWAYVRASLNYYETNSVGTVIVGTITYRQATLLSGVIPLAPYAQESILAPSQVQDWGRVVGVQNFSPRTRDPKMRDVIEFVREFRG